MNLWIGPWSDSLDVDSVAGEAQSLNLFSVLSQILGSCPVKTMNRFQFESGCQISKLRISLFFLMSALCVSSSDVTEGQRKSIFLWKMRNPIIQYRSQLCPLRMSLGTRLFPPIRWKWTLISPNAVCYLRRAQRLSLFPYARFNQRKFVYLLSRADLAPRLTLSSTLYLPPDSSLPLTFPELRRSIVFYPATNLSNLGDIG
jgi:hypothetical protein